MLKIGIAFGVVAAMVLAGLPAQAAGMTDVQSFQIDVSKAGPGDLLDISLVNGVLQASLVHPSSEVALPANAVNFCATANPAALTCDGVLGAAGANTAAYHLIVAAGVYGGLQGAGNVDSIQAYAGGQHIWRCSLAANGFVVGILLISGSCGHVYSGTQIGAWTWHGSQDATILGTPILYLVV